MGVGASQRLDDQRVIEDAEIVHIDGLAGDESHGVLLADRLIYTFKHGSGAPFSTGSGS